MEKTTKKVAKKTTTTKKTTAKKTTTKSTTVKNMIQNRRQFNENGVVSQMTFGSKQVSSRPPCLILL